MGPRFRGDDSGWVAFCIDDLSFPLHRVFGSLRCS